MVVKYQARAERKRKLFVSRLSRSRKNPHYRVLQNEEELAAMLEALGFAVIEPELLPLEEQISAFAAAEQVVFLGGSGVFDAVFCAGDKHRHHRIIEYIYQRACGDAGLAGASLRGDFWPGGPARSN